MDARAVPEGDLSDDFDATGNTKSREAGFQLLARGSTYVLARVVKGSIGFEDAELHKREAYVIGSRNALKADFGRVMKAIRSGCINTAALPSAEIFLVDLPARDAALADDREDLIKAIVRA